MVRHQLAVALVLLKEGVLWVENSIAKLGDELFQKASTVYSLLLLAMLVHKLNLEFLLQINFIHKNFVE